MAAPAAGHGASTGAPARAAARPAVLVVQDGARHNYAVPVALARAGILDRALTEWYSAPGSWQERAARLIRAFQPALGRRMVERRHPALAAGLVRTNPWLLLRQELARLGFADATGFHRWRSTTVTAWAQRQGFGRANVLYGSVGNLDPALARAARAQGLLTIGDQIIAPAAVQAAERQRQLERWPDWAPAAAPDPARASAMVSWERQTWSALDHITYPSAYVRDGLLAAGLDPARITLAPYAAHLGPAPAPRRAGPGEPLMVGFVGAVNLRKGAPYFVEIARRLGRRGARFVMVGPVELSAAGISQARDAVDLVGPVARSAVGGWLARFDLFYFPSTCEGSAGAVMEALAAGLPVVTSPNSGSVVQDGREGYLVPYDDLDQAEARIAALIADRSLRRSLGEAARRRAAEFSLDHSGALLVALIERLQAGRAAAPGDQPAGA